MKTFTSSDGRGGDMGKIDMAADVMLPGLEVMIKNCLIEIMMIALPFISFSSRESSRPRSPHHQRYDSFPSEKQSDIKQDHRILHFIRLALNGLCRLGSKSQSKKDWTISREGSSHS